MNKQGWPYTNDVDPEIYKDKADWPKISIVTPSYNQGQFIEETILSILNQNYPNLEYIIIDGGSTDNTVEIIKKYEDRITYWVSEPDKGQSHAINKGFEKATGEIFAYLNSDDCYYPEILKKIVSQFYGTNKPTLVYGNSLNGSKFDKIDFCIKGNNQPFNPHLGYGHIPQPSAFWSKTKIQFDTQFQFTMDQDYWTKLFDGGYDFKYLDENIAFYREHTEAKGHSIKNIMWVEELILSLNSLKKQPSEINEISFLNDFHSKLTNYYRVFLENSKNKKELIQNWKHIVQTNPKIGFKTLRYFVSLLRK